MMIHSQSIQKIKKVAFSLLVGSLIVSCGSYQEASYYDNDGIYSTGTRQQVTEAEAAPNNQANEYQDYFGQQANEYGAI